MPHHLGVLQETSFLLWQGGREPVRGPLTTLKSLLWQPHSRALTLGFLALGSCLWLVPTPTLTPHPLLTPVSTIRLVPRVSLVPHDLLESLPRRLLLAQGGDRGEGPVWLVGGSLVMLTALRL